jgi:hypothetical protein
MSQETNDFETAHQYIPFQSGPITLETSSCMRRSHTLDKLAKALGVDASELIESVPDEQG